MAVLRGTADHAWVIARTLAVPTLSSLLCFLFIVIEPLSNLCGPYPFLVYTSLILFFFPYGKIYPQLEATVLGILGGGIGLAWSTAVLAVAAYCGRTYGPDSVQSRAVLAMGLMLLSLISGFLRSAVPSLTVAARITLFFPTFLLTSSTAITEVESHHFLNQFMVVVFSAAFGLVPALLFPHPSSAPLIQARVLDAIKLCNQLFPLSLETVFGATAQDRLEALDTGKQDMLARSLRDTISKLASIYDVHSREFTHSRLPPAAYDPLVKSLQTIHRNPLLEPTSHVPGKRIQTALDRTYGFSPPVSRSQSRNRDSAHVHEHGPATQQNEHVHVHVHSNTTHPGHRGHRRTHSSSHVARPVLIAASHELVDALSAAFDSAAATMDQVSDHPSDKSAKPVLEAKTDLETALSNLQQKLAILLQDLGNVESQDRDHFRLAFYLTALLDLAKDVLDLLVIVSAVTNQASTKRWHIPHLTPFGASTDNPTRNGAEGQSRIDDAAQVQEEFDLDTMDYATASKYRARDQGESQTVQRAGKLWRKVWDDPGVVRARIDLSALFRSSRRSGHIRFALKLSAGMMLLSLPTFFPPDSPGKHWFDHYRVAWAVVSYMYVLEVHTGATIKIGLFRMAGTFLGAVASYVCTRIAHGNPYALVVLATALSVPISYLVLLSPYPAIGIVSGITVPPLLFISYLGYADGLSDFDLAWTRFIDIIIGIVSAVLVGSFVWPNHARVRYFRAIATTFESATDYYLSMSRDLVRQSLVYHSRSSQYALMEAQVRNGIKTCRNLIDIQRQEVSLLPRPVQLYVEVVDAAEQLIDQLIDIRTLRYSVPRKLTVLDVMSLRRELISAVLINLWALGQCFRSRSPLPQYLPSPRAPLESIMAAVEGHAWEIGRGRRPESDSEGQDRLSILYGMAENEALSELCDILDELVAAARTLFGSRKFQEM